MSFQKDVVLAALRKHTEPVTSVQLANELQDEMDRESVMRTLHDLAKADRIVKLERAEVPEHMRGRGSPKMAWQYLSKPAVPINPDTDTDAELAALLKQRIAETEDPADPEAALGEWPGDAVAHLPATDTDPAIAAIAQLRLCKPVPSARQDAVFLRRLADRMTAAQTDPTRIVASRLRSIAVLLEDAA